MPNLLRPFRSFTLARVVGEAVAVVAAVLIGALLYVALPSSDATDPQASAQHATASEAGGRMGQEP